MHDLRCRAAPTPDPPRLRNVTGQSRENPFLRTPLRRGGVLFYLSNRGDAGLILCRGDAPPVPHCARTLSKTPAVCHFPKNRLSASKSIFATPPKPGVLEGVFGFLVKNRLYLPFRSDKPFICDPTDVKVAARLSKWFHSVLPGGFDRKSLKTSSCRPPGMAFSTLPNYFSEIVAKMFPPVLK